MCLHHQIHDCHFSEHEKGKLAKASLFRSTFFLYIAALCMAFVSGWFQIECLHKSAEVFSEVFIKLLRLVSLPLLFLSVITALKEVNARSSCVSRLMKKLVGYTFLTTYLAAMVGLVLFVYIDPTQSILLSGIENAGSSSATAGVGKGYVSHFMTLLPSNAISPFIEGNVIGVLLLASLMAFASFHLSPKERDHLFEFFSALYRLFMVITGWIVRLIPLALWAFVTLFIHDLKNGLGSHLESLGLYLLVIFAANTIQGLIVLPLLLLRKGISPIFLVKAMFPALSVAFFTKSSSATVPTAIQAAVERAKVSESVARSSFPLCTTINMNGCAAFILVTSLFVMKAHGIEVEFADMVLWTLIATVAAVGNAGVPMGCYFLTSALLASMNIPLTIMGLILPFYTLIDAYETALNIWSDSCVAKMVDIDLAKEDKV